MIRSLALLLLVAASMTSGAAELQRLELAAVAYVSSSLPATVVVPPSRETFIEDSGFGGYGHDTVWLRLDDLLPNPDTSSILVAGPWWVDRINAWVLAKDGGTLRPLEVLAVPGFFTPHSFILPKDADVTVYITMTSATSMPSVVTVWAEDVYREELWQQRSYILMASGLGCYLAMDAGVLPNAVLAQVQGNMALLNPLYILPAIVGGLGTLRWILSLLGDQRKFIGCLKPLQLALAFLWGAGFFLGGTYLLQLTNLLVIGFGLLIVIIAMGSLWQTLWSSLGLLSLGLMVLAITLTWIPFTQPLLSSMWITVGRLLMPVLLLAAGIAILIWALKRDADERESLRQAQQRGERDYRKKLESEVSRRTLEAEKSRQIAEDLARIKDRFVTAIAHDLRSPLTTIVGVAELEGAADPKLEPAQQSKLLKQASNYMLDVLDDLTLFERLQTARVTPQRQQVELQQLGDDVVSLLGPKADGRGVTLALNIDTPTTTLVTDRRYIARILVNLTANALDACTEGGRVTLQIGAIDVEKGVALKLVVSDTGQGLDADALRALQLGESAGYGFTVVRDLVNALGGRWDIQSTPGEGTAVSVITPVFGVTDQNTNETWSAGSLLSLRLLLVEDLPENRLVLSTLLESMGHTVTPASCLADAYRHLQREAFDVALIDRQLPDGDGLIALSSMKALFASEALLTQNTHRPPRFIMLTADAQYAVRQEALRAGYEQVLSKPVTEKELHQTLGKTRYGAAEAEFTGSKDYLHLLLEDDKRQVLEGFRATATDVREQLLVHDHHQRTADIAAACHKLIGSAECVGEWDLAALARSYKDALTRGDQAQTSSQRQCLLASLGTLLSDT